MMTAQYDVFPGTATLEQAREQMTAKYKAKSAWFVASMGVPPGDFGTRFFLMQADLINRVDRHYKARPVPKMGPYTFVGINGATRVFDPEKDRFFDARFTVMAVDKSLVPRSIMEAVAGKRLPPKKDLLAFIGSPECEVPLVNIIKWATGTEGAIFTFG